MELGVRRREAGTEGLRALVRRGRFLGEAGRLLLRSVYRMRRRVLVGSLALGLTGAWLWAGWPPDDCADFCLEMQHATGDFEFFDNESGTPDGRYIVPNYVHYIRYQQEEVSFTDAVCILSALKNQNPDILFIHTDAAPRGKYWDVITGVARYRRKIRIRRAPKPQYIFGTRMKMGWNNHHAADFCRLRIMMQYGGIFLDNDVYIVRSLNDYRSYEMSIGWAVGSDSILANQAMIANRNARFLKLWLESYREYNKSVWYWNASVKPTNQILRRRPALVHREPSLLCSDLQPHRQLLHLLTTNWTDWNLQSAIHLLFNHQYLVANLTPRGASPLPVVFDHSNILTYAVTFRHMASLVYPYPSFSLPHRPSGVLASLWLG